MSQLAKLPPAIVSLEDFDESKNVLVYGPSGAGKTVLAGSANTLILASEKGTVSAKRQGSTAKAWPIAEWSDLQAAYSWIKSNPDHGFDWIAMDSAPEMQAKLKAQILSEAIAKRPEHNPDSLELPDWMPYYERYKKTIRGFCNLPVNMLFTAIPMTKEDEEGDNITLPDIEGKGYQLSSWTCAQMTAYGYMSVKNIKRGDEKVKKRRILWEMEPPYMAKDRYDVFGHHTDDITLEQINSIMDGNPLSENGQAPSKGRNGNKSRRTA